MEGRLSEEPILGVRAEAARESSVVGGYVGGAWVGAEGHGAGGEGPWTVRS